MRDLHVTSLPVRSKDDGDYKGFFDTLDVVTSASFLLFLLLSISLFLFSIVKKIC